MIYENDKLPAITISQYLSDKLNLSYGYITNVLRRTLILLLRILLLFKKLKEQEIDIRDQLTLTEFV
jgi:hypothetical protein